MLQPDRRLIELLADAPRPSGLDRPAAEVAFVMRETGALAVPWDDDAVGDYLSHHTSRDHGDLRRQAQRVFAALAREESDALYGALVDLFLTLGDKGWALRARLLLVARPHLAIEQYRCLNESLARGLSVRDRIPLAVDSRLSRGVTGTCDLVEPLAPPGMHDAQAVLAQ